MVLSPKLSVLENSANNFIQRARLGNLPIRRDGLLR